MKLQEQWKTGWCCNISCQDEIKYGKIYQNQKSECILQTFIKLSAREVKRKIENEFVSIYPK